jgi:hypothetical protein
MQVPVPRSRVTVAGRPSPAAILELRLAGMVKGLVIRERQVLI